MSNKKPICINLFFYIVDPIAYHNLVGYIPEFPQLDLSFLQCKLLHHRMD